MALLMAGTGLTSTLIGVRADLEGFNTTVTGFVLSGFYLGFLCGSRITPRTIWRVGHVRVFAGLASLASAAVLVHTIRPDPLSWFLLRAMSGLCLSGLYVVTETWLNGAATNRTRGSLLAGYMVVVTAAMGIGQLLFPVADAGGYAAFVMASVLVSVAVVPVSLATVSPPEVPEITRLPLPDLWRVAPLAVVGALVSGLSGAALIGGGGALYAAHTGLRPGQTSMLLFAALVGALAFQIPFGRWSDRTDRRRVVIAGATVGAAAAAAAAVAGTTIMTVLVVLTALVGGTSFVLYSLANAHLNDHLDDEQVVAAGSAMVLVFGLGAVTGPVVVATGIDVAGPAALFVLLAVSYGAVAAFAAWRLTRRPAVPEEERSSYTALPAGTGPTAATLTDAPPEALYPEPVEETVVETDTGDLTYVNQGTGPAVVLLGPGPTVMSESLLAAFAVNGVTAVGVELRRPRSPDEGPVTDLLAVLRDLELSSATFVGLDGGAGPIVDVVVEHPDRVDGAALVGASVPIADDQIELEGRALLVLLDSTVARDDPGLFADTIVDFVRHKVQVEV